ncbi:MAG: GTP-binding protein [Puniceicoccaceae bacterium]
MPPIPVHLVLGSLGSGKTTAIQRLLESAPPDETWAVLVNEFGRVAIDPHLIEGSPSVSPARLIVKESHGGCLCCSGALELATGLRDLTENYRPDRIIIEPTGLSDPKSMKRQVCAAESDCNIVLASTMAVVDVRQLGHRRFRDMPFLHSLLENSDFVYGSKMDIADDGTAQRFKERIAEYSEQHQTRILEEAELPSGEWIKRSTGVSVPFEPQFTLPHLESADTVTVDDDFPHGAKRIIERKSGYLLDGWLFDEGTCFDSERLYQLIHAHLREESHIIRLKGIFRTEQGWFSIQSVEGETPTCRPTGNGRDSRLEIIMKPDDPSITPEAIPFEKALSARDAAIDCLVS